MGNHGVRPAPLTITSYSKQLWRYPALWDIKVACLLRVLGRSSLCPAFRPIESTSILDVCFNRRLHPPNGSYREGG